MMTNEEITAELTAGGTTESLFDVLTDAGTKLSPMPDRFRKPEHLITGCLSQTYFGYARNNIGRIYIYGESQSTTLEGVIYYLQQYFNGVVIDHSLDKPTWHYDSGLMAHLTPQRQQAVLQMIDRCSRFFRE